MILKRVKAKIERIYEKYISKIDRGILLKSHFFYINYLKVIKGYKFPPKIPTNIKWMNTTLKTNDDVKLAIEIIKKSHLNLHSNIPEKNWDSLIALNIILQNTNRTARVLDAGGQINSLILSWLYQFNYINLSCVNLIYDKKIKRGKIEFIPGDLTKTPYPDDYFDIVTCLSVIEHGVNEENYFKEINRILKNGGLLITSTDYWEEKINTESKFAYGNLIFIYDNVSVKNLLKKAYNKGFELYGPDIDLNCKNKVVSWKIFNLDYTFLIFCLKKKP